MVSPVSPFFRQPHPVDPAGAMISTAEDMAKWLQFHINDGRVSYNGRALLPKEFLLQTYQPEMASPFPMNRRDLWKPKYPVSDINMSYNMGWLTNIYRGDNLILFLAI